MLTAAARDRWNASAVFKFCFCFVLLYNKSLNYWSLGEQWILFPSNLNVSVDFVSGKTLRFLGNKIHCSTRDQSFYKCLISASSPGFSYFFLAQRAIGRLEVSKRAGACSRQLGMRQPSYHMLSCGTQWHSSWRKHFVLTFSSKYDFLKSEDLLDLCQRCLGCTQHLTWTVLYFVVVTEPSAGTN